ncbi:DUF4129 domain-containing protein [Thermococcus thioreducens]|uniref:Protein-glutamine gamma-glutamyltransferase-like C-terminal domain-containing protein n=1 Tax=Thermococcus thioreducens TaxID=277988 RepID=A0A0Q2M6B8_9EURY|nr:DUF4129 domain-containing protein [Thermococcus thioreducens]ASJ11423.1 hypothetical protein A3L14_00325 [Thermococcus thioreducens]KQH83442.1 hypothetical protein AMR53_00330 [Thermococcus thioreducens]SEW06985.1 protein of unknown function [Thermococcus thioreducens]
MSTRVKFLALSGLLFSLMTLMINYSATTSSAPRGSSAPWTGVLLIVLAIVGLFVIIGVLLGWRDPFRRDEGGGFGFLTYIAIVFGGIVGGVVFRMMKKRPLGFPANDTSVNGSVNGSLPLQSTTQSPTYHNVSLTPAREALSSQYLLYALLVVVIVVFAYLAVIQYREYLQKKERKEMKLRAELFDKKLDELGLEMFENPREAIVGVYKNAVLWLNYLGIPYEESWTHWEHAEHVRYMHDAFVELTRLFEKAKYAPEKITWDDARRALRVYREMRRGVDEV